MTFFKALWAKRKTRNRHFVNLNFSQRQMTLKGKKVNYVYCVAPSIALIIVRYSQT